MFLRLAQLYRRYVTHHLCLRLGVVPIATGQTVSVVLRQGRICVARDGRVPGDTDDVLLEQDGTQASGFAPSLPYTPGAPIRVSLRNATADSVIFPAPSRLRWIAAHLALWPGLLRRMVQTLPLLPRIGDPHVRSRAKARLGLVADHPAPMLHPAPQGKAERQLSSPIAILLPVHNARSHVAHCLDRVARMTDLPWRLVIVEDGSTDPALRPMLLDWVAAYPDASLICHDSPLGFAASVNVGLAALGKIDSPVVLLNSDVTLPRGWASRLIAPLLSDKTIASVTPLSNEGELMGAPHACAGVALRNGEVDRVDAALAPFARHSDLPSLPTGSGFCMALSPHWLAHVPRLDESFGRGYGEEVDWCQRTRALGGRHVCQTGLFVGHVGAASFGAAQRQILRARSAPILSRRWPRFDAEVAQAQAADPLAGDRLRAGLLWARARLNGSPLPLYLAHSLGGGTERWLEQRLQSHEVAVVLRVGGPLRWQLELHTQVGITRGATAQFAVIQSLLRHAGPRRVTYVCAVGDPAPEEIPFRLLDLCAGGHRLEVMVHDYFPLNRDYTFRSATDSQWCALWRVALDRANHLTVFSQASRKIVAEVHPDLAHKIRLRPHGPLGPVPRLSAAPFGRCVLAVPGHLNIQKGAAVVRDLARVFARTDEARLVVLGEVAPDCPLPRSVTVLGGYTLEDLPHLVARHGIGAWLIPSLWPETFSYVTQESLATGLPCIGFDLGGQGEALRAAPNGHVVSLRNGGAPDIDALLRMLRALPDWPARPVETGFNLPQKWPLRRVRV
ncbi:MAG: glycosyltransferase [Pelagibaca sp.]